MKMPIRYVVEMFLDRIAASRVYKGTHIRTAIRWSIIWAEKPVI